MSLLMEKLVNKWENHDGKTSISGIEDIDIKENTAQLLENQENTDFGSVEGLFGGGLLTEDAAGAPGAVIDGDQGSAWGDNVYKSDPSNVFRPVSMALVRRTFPDLFAHKVAGVQPMKTPYGVAFAMRLVYAGTDIEAGWDNVPGKSGFTGDGTTGDDLGAGMDQIGVDLDGTSNDVAASAEGLVVPDHRLPNSGVGSATGAMAQLEMKIAQRAIKAQTRKVATSFSLEAAQDVRAMHNIDIEREMVNILDYEVKAELDRQILHTIKTVAIDTDVKVGGAAAVTINLTDSSAKYGRWTGEAYATIAAAIIAQSNNISITTRRGAGNMAVCSPDIVSALQGLGHVFVNYDSKVKGNQSVAYVGKLNGTIDIFRDQYATESYALVAYKGSGISDAGIIYSPYLMGVTNRAVSPGDFSPRIGVMSRYAITRSLLGAGRYYRMLKFTNLDKFMPAGGLPLNVPQS